MLGLSFCGGCSPRFGRHRLLSAPQREALRQCRGGGDPKAATPNAGAAGGGEARRVSLGFARSWEEQQPSARDPRTSPGLRERRSPGRPLGFIYLFFIIIISVACPVKKPARAPHVCRGSYAPRQARGPPRKPPAPLACPEPLDTERRFAARGPGRETVLGGPWGRWRLPWRAHVDAALRWARRRTAVTGAASPTGAGRGLGPSLLGRAAKASPAPAAGRSGRSSQPRPSPPVGLSPFSPRLAPRESGPRVGAGCRGRRELRPRPSRLPKPLAGGAEAAGRGVPAGLRRGGFPDCVSACVRLYETRIGFLLRRKPPRYADYSNLPGEHGV